MSTAGSTVDVVSYEDLYERWEAGNWSASHNLTGAQYQAEFDKRRAAGYRLKQVDSYPVGNQIRYAAIFVKDGAAVAAYRARRAGRTSGARPKSAPTPKT